MVKIKKNLKKKIFITSSKQECFHLSKNKSKYFTSLKIQINSLKLIQSSLWGAKKECN